MVNKRKQGFTQARSKLTSHRMKSATVGTHVPRSSRHMNGESVGFSSPRKQKRAARGVVDTILPTTASGELVAVRPPRQPPRVHPGNTAQGARAPHRRDRGLPARGGVPSPPPWAWRRSSGRSRTVTVVSIPPTLQVSLKDGKTHPLREAQTQEGDAALVSAVADFAGVDVAHYVKIDAESIVRLVDALGGIEVNVAEEVDDPNAGDAYLQPGTQTLDGAKALTFLRASNFTDGLESQAANQRAFLTALSLRLLGDGSVGFLTTLDNVSWILRTCSCPWGRASQARARTSSRSRACRFLRCILASTRRWATASRPAPSWPEAR